jgi:peptidoglycan-associated lipoprotein
MSQFRTYLATFALLSLAACSNAPKNDKTDAAETAGQATTGDSTITAETNAAGRLIGIDGRPIASQGAPSQYLIHFEYNVSNILSSQHAVLDRHAQYLNAHPQLRLRLEGHADERGSREYNLALGESRGQAVQRYLTIRGVNNSRVDVLSYGEEKPLNIERHESSWQENRRVNLVYLEG